MSLVVHTTRVVILAGSASAMRVCRLTKPGALLCASPLRSSSFLASSIVLALAQWWVRTPIIRPPEGLPCNDGVRAQAPAQHPHQTLQVLPSFDVISESPRTHSCSLPSLLHRFSQLASALSRVA